MIGHTKEKIWFSTAAILAAFTLVACSDHQSTTAPVVTTGAAADVTASDEVNGAAKIRHVLLISIDGMHQSDLTRFVQTHPSSALAGLVKQGVSFTNSRTSRPSDSFPGLLAQVTGGSPKSTGVYYDNSYDRELYAPGSGCVGPKGTEVVYDESIDRNPDALDAGGGIDPAALPLKKKNGVCAPVYPHEFLRVNTIFEVAKAAGLRTAWSDKHPAYDIVNGPSGKGVDDLFTPEINGGPYTDNAANAISYDAIKVDATLRQIDGKSHDGSTNPGVPAIFGMNFQAVSVGQKTAGYTNAAGTPSADLESAIEFVDASLGKMVKEIQSQGLANSTLIIVSAKHGQSPIDPSKRRIVDEKLLPNVVNGVKSGLVAKSTEDDIGLLWLSDQSRTRDAANAIRANAASMGVASVLQGSELERMFADPRRDSRVPDLIALTDVGVIYAKPTASKLEEHGGFSENDTHVLLVVSKAGIEGRKVDEPVETRQIAPTILRALGLKSSALEAVRIEGTRALPLAGVAGRGDED